MDITTMLRCQLCNRDIRPEELVMWGRPDGIIEPKNQQFIIGTQVHLMPNSMIACVYHPPPELAYRLRQRLQPYMMYAPAGYQGRVQICRFFQQGHCKKGESCNFSHDATSVTRGPCAFWQRGTCRNGSTCRFQHIGPPGVPRRERARATATAGDYAPSMGPGGEQPIDEMFAEMLTIGYKPWELPPGGWHMGMGMGGPVYGHSGPEGRPPRKNKHKKSGQNKDKSGDTGSGRQSAEPKQATTPSMAASTALPTTKNGDAAAPATASPSPSAPQAEDSGVGSTATTATPSPQPQPQTATEEPAGATETKAEATAVEAAS